MKQSMQNRNQKLIDRFLMGEIQPQRNGFIQDQKEVREFLKQKGWRFTLDDEDAGGSNRNDISFSIFNEKHSEIVATYSKILKQISTDKHKEGISSVLQYIYFGATDQNKEAVQYALLLFLTHNDLARPYTITPFIDRHSYLLDRNKKRNDFNSDAHRSEYKLNWFREDIFLAEHHEHWHLVYPSIPTSAEEIKERQGELFLYMHQQMLARYNTERITAGLGMVQAFPQTSFQDVIELGYDPGLGPKFGLRRPAKKLLHVRSLEDLDYRSGLIEGAIKHGDFPDEDTLGNTIDRNAKTLCSIFGDLHDSVHSLVAQVSSGTGLGVMRYPQTSHNDPIFYQWHRYIDDLSVDYQKRVEVETGIESPKVLFEEKDIILCFEDKLKLCLVDSKKTNLSVSTKDFEILGENLFGNEEWNVNTRERQDVTTDTLFTFMDRSEIKSTDGGQSKAIDYLDLKREFAYFLRIKNMEEVDQDVTGRIWLAAEDHIHDRRMWIEMDTFQASLRADQVNVVYRSSRMSSVIKKSNGIALRPSQTLSVGDSHTKSSNSGDYCDCGWPYNLLLPKGTASGMKFNLLVMLTQNDYEAKPQQCGSVSYCGVRDSEHPDKKKMGYPFNRPFPKGETILDLVERQANMAMRQITIKFCGA